VYTYVIHRWVYVYSEWLDAADADRNTITTNSARGLACYLQEQVSGYSFVYLSSDQEHHLTPGDRALSCFSTRWSDFAVARCGERREKKKKMERLKLAANVIATPFPFIKFQIIVISANELQHAILWTAIHLETYYDTSDPVSRMAYAQRWHKSVIPIMLMGWDKTMRNCWKRSTE